MSLINIADSTLKCNSSLDAKEYLIGHFKTHTFSWAVLAFSITRLIIFWVLARAGGIGYAS